jgi:hypothetical protein
MDPANGIREVFGLDGLGHVPAGPGANHRDHVFCLIRDREGEELHIRIGLRHSFNHRDPTTVGHVDIDQDYIRLQTPDFLDGGIHVMRRAHDPEFLVQLRLHTGEKETMVVDQVDVDVHSASLSKTSVPSPGSLSMPTTPPAFSIRDRIDWEIPFRSGGTSSGLNPDP